MSEGQIYRFVGYDPHGIPRAWGTDYTPSGAYEQCAQEATEYVRGRPDTGPLSNWRFHRDDQ